MLTPEALKEGKIVSQEVFDEIVDEIKEVWLKEQVNINEEKYYLYRNKKGKFVAEALKEKSIPVPSYVLDIVETYRNTKLSRKKVEEVVKKELEGKPLSLEDKVLVFKAQEKLGNYGDLFINLLPKAIKGILSDIFWLTPDILADKIIPFKPHTLRVPLIKELEKYKGKEFPMSAVYFLLTDFYRSDSNSRYLVLNNLSLGFVHDDSLLKDFPFRQEFEKKLGDIIEKEKDFYILKQAFSNYELSYLLSPVEYYLCLDRGVLLEELEEEEVKKRYLEYGIKRQFGETIYEDLILKKIRESSSRKKLPKPN